MEDISIVLGVSINTVSKALNNKPDVSPKTRQKVLETAKKMGYVPNSLAKSLVTRSTGTIGIIVPSVRISIYTELVEAIMERAAKMNYSTFLAISVGEVGNEAAAIENLYQKRVDGMIVVPVDRHPAYHSSFRVFNLPLLYVLSDTDYDDSYFVGVNLRDCARLVTEHLYESGCRRIALLCSTCTGMKTDIETGFVETLREHGVENPLQHVFQPSLSQMPQDAGFEVAQILDPCIDSYDGVVLEHEFLYFGLHELLDQHALSCPGDLLVAACAGCGRGRSLTSINIDPQQIGYDALSMLMDLIHYRNNVAEKKVVTAPKLTIRKSSRRPG